MRWIQNQSNRFQFIPVDHFNVIQLVIQSDTIKIDHIDLNLI